MIGALKRSEKKKNLSNRVGPLGQRAACSSIQSLPPSGGVEVIQPEIYNYIYIYIYFLPFLYIYILKIWFKKQSAAEANRS